MKLRHIIFDVEASRPQGRLGFINEASCITYFLTDEIRKLSCETGEYNAISIEMSTKADKVTCKYFQDNLQVIFPVTDGFIDGFVSKDDHDKIETILNYFEEGYRKAKEFNPTVPLDTLLAIHDKYRQMNYIYEWPFWKKVFIKELNMRVEFVCHIDIHEFNLTMKLVDRKTKNVLNFAVIFRTRPDWMFFHKTFRSAFVQDGFLFITDFLKHPSFVFDMEDIKSHRIKGLRTGQIPDELAVKHIDLIDHQKERRRKHGLDEITRPGGKFGDIENVEFSLQRAWLDNCFEFLLKVPFGKDFLLNGEWLHFYFIGYEEQTDKKLDTENEFIRKNTYLRPRFATDNELFIGEFENGDLLSYDISEGKIFRCSQTNKLLEIEINFA